MSEVDKNRLNVLVLRFIERGIVDSSSLSKIKLGIGRVVFVGFDGSRVVSFGPGSGIGLNLSLVEFSSISVLTSLRHLEDVFVLEAMHGTALPVVYLLLPVANHVESGI